MLMQLSSTKRCLARGIMARCAQRASPVLRVAHMTVTPIELLHNGSTYLRQVAAVYYLPDCEKEFSDTGSPGECVVGACGVLVLATTLSLYLCSVVRHRRRCAAAAAC